MRRIMLFGGYIPPAVTARPSSLLPYVRLACTRHSKVPLEGAHGVTVGGGGHQTALVRPR